MCVQVWLKATTCSVLRVRYVISSHWAFARDLTYFRHCCCLLFAVCALSDTQKLLEFISQQPVTTGRLLRRRVLYQKGYLEANKKR
jgi:hypothetical protein